MKDGERNGQGTSYHENGNKEYEGQWKDNILILSVSTNYVNIDEIDECSICMDNKCNVITKCNHQFCLQCLAENCARSKDCPVCRQHINIVDNIVINKN